jgi:HlyD family secretion protein
MRQCTLWLACLLSIACGDSRPSQVVQAAANATSTAPNPASIAKTRQVRATGTIQAVRAYTVTVPRIQGQAGRQTLVDLIPNGVSVKDGDLLAEFDRTAQLDLSRDSKAKYEELANQIEQKRAAIDQERATRMLEIQKADAELLKARLQLTKGPLLAEIDREKNEVKAKDAELRLASLRKSHDLRIRAEDASIRVLELQRERQKIAWERAEKNAEKMILKAPLAGMVALETIWRSGSMGKPQEGDQLYNGEPLLKIFDPTEMEVKANVGEPDGAILQPGVKAKVYLDAYPDAAFSAVFVSASPVASAPIGSPIKSFTARFRLEQRDVKLLPDLSAAIVVERPQ